MTALRVPGFGAIGHERLPERLRVGVCSFSDDLVLPPRVGDPPGAGRRAPTEFGDEIPAGLPVAVRVRIVERGDGGLIVDFGDSDPAPVQPPTFRITGERVEVAVVMALSRALGLSSLADPRLCVRVTVRLADDSWVGAPVDDAEPAVVAFAMARVYDAVLGALANAWRDRVGAGSCTLGAVVSLRAGDLAMHDVVPGGEGATPARAGTDAWPGLFSGEPTSPIEGIAITESLRDGSGGIGARCGGAGVERRYAVAHATTARVAIDRITNPPHGLDRAGPPSPAELWLHPPAGPPTRAPAWTDLSLPPGTTLIVRTAGGAGHGFPGWGVDWSG